MMKNNIEIEYKTNTAGNEYVGINLNKNNKLSILLPVGYNEPTEAEKDKKQYKEDIKKLMKLLAKKTNIQYKSIDDTEISFDLGSAIEILEDYLEYGLYKQIEIKSKLNQRGRINWKKTINSPQIYINGNITYNNIYVKNVDYIAEKEIQQIQEYCLSTISTIIGFVWNFTYTNIPKKFNNIEMIELLNEELKNTNQDKKINMLQHLLSFVKNTNFEKLKKGNICLKYKEFNYIWQELVNVLGLATSDKAQYNPKAKYCFWKSNYEDKDIKVNPSIPDTIVKDLKGYEEYVFILDAKYYKIGNFPNEYDIFKQTRYGEYVENILQGKNEKRKIINAFILPNTLNDAKIEIKDFYAKIDKETSKLKSYEKIFLVYVDTRTLISNPEATMYFVLEKLKNWEISPI